MFWKKRWRRKEGEEDGEEGDGYQLELSEQQDRPWQPKPGQLCPALCRPESLHLLFQEDKMPSQDLGQSRRKPVIRSSLGTSTVCSRIRTI